MRDRLSYANVMSTLGVFIALGGTSYAVAKLPRNSVGQAQLRRDAVTGEKVRDGSISATDLAEAARAAGPRGPRGPEGPAGTPGSSGATGAPGASGVAEAYYVRSDGATTPGPPNTRVEMAKLSLPAGTWLLSFTGEGVYFPTGVPHEVLQHCRLETNGSFVVQSGVVIGDSAPATYVSRHAITRPVTVATPFTATVVCSQDRNFDGASGVNRPGVGSVDFTAVRLTRLNGQ